MRKYLALIRYDHWIKQLFVLPGILVALVIVPILPAAGKLCINAVIGLLSTSLIASSNYVLNEWLDAKTDRYHPVKKERISVTEKLNSKIVFALYFALFIMGMALSIFLPFYFSLTMLLLWLMGIIYNVKPLRTKDIPYIDVYTESMNNALRFLAGWFVVTDAFYPPVSIVFGYWFAGAFLMATKRFSEYRMFEDSQTAVLYRKSFKTYNEERLLILSFFNGMLSVLFVGIFLIKYRIELIFFMPFYMGLFCYYTHIAYKEDSAAQRPEKLYKDKILLLYILLLAAVFTVAMLVDIPMLEQFLSNVLIPID